MKLVSIAELGRGQQRLGAQTETYTIIFETAKGQYTYTTSDFELYQQCQIGSQWTLHVNAFGNVVSIEPFR